MKKTINKGILAAAVTAAVLLAGCEKKFSDPAPFTPVEIPDSATISIAQLLAKYPGRGNPLLITGEVNIKGKVVSSDATGNIFNTIYIQDDVPAGAGSAISIKVGRTSLFNFYPPGMILSVKAKGLTLGGYGNMVSLGSDPTYVAGVMKYENSNIAPDMMIQSVLLRGNIVGMVPGVNGDTTRIAAKADYSGKTRLLGRLVRIRATFYKNPALDTWAVIGATSNNNTPAYGEQYLRFTGSTSNDIVIRTSGYSTFAGRSVAAFNGHTVDVTGILTIFNTTYQLALNSDADVVIVN